MQCSGLFLIFKGIRFQRFNKLSQAPCLTWLHPRALPNPTQSVTLESLFWIHPKSKPAPKPWWNLCGHTANAPLWLLGFRQQTSPLTSGPSSPGVGRTALLPRGWCPLKQVIKLFHLRSISRGKNILHANKQSSKERSSWGAVDIFTNREVKLSVRQQNPDHITSSSSPSHHDLWFTTQTPD